MRVIIIDDDKANLVVIKATATFLGYNVVTFSTFVNVSYEAICLANAIICDKCVNGDGDSKYFLQNVRKINKNCLIVLISGGACLKADYFDLFYQKPFSVKKMFYEIQRILSGNLN